MRPRAPRPTPVPPQEIRIVVRKCTRRAASRVTVPMAEVPAAGSIVDASYLSLISNQYLRTIVIAGRPDIGNPDWKNDVKRTTAHARTGLRRGRMARIQTSRVTAGSEQLNGYAEKTTRRNFLFRLGIAINAIAIALFAIPIVGYVLSPARRFTWLDWIPSARWLTIQKIRRDWRSI